MFSFIKSIPKDILIMMAGIIVILLIVSYQWGYINGEKSKS